VTVKMCVSCIVHLNMAPSIFLESCPHYSRARQRM
jgi:hypothetical protein